MTSDDELLKRLDVSHLETFEQDDTECVCMDSILETYHWAATHIRELTAERDEAVTQMVEANMERDKAQDRVRELEAELKKQTIRTEFWKQKARLAQPVIEQGECCDATPTANARRP